MRPLALLLCALLAHAANAQREIRVDALNNGSGESADAVVAGKLKKKPYYDVPGWKVSDGSFFAQTSGALSIKSLHGERYLRAGPENESRVEQSVELASLNGRPRHVVCRAALRTGKDADKGEILLTLLDADGTDLAERSTGLIVSRNRWRQHRLLVAVPDDAARARVTLRAVKKSGKYCDVYFDDVALEPIRRGCPVELTALSARDLIAGRAQAANDQTRRAYLVAMAGMGGNEIAKELAKQLDGAKDKRQRAELIEALTLSQTPTATTVVKSLLHGSDATDRTLALEQISLLPYDWRGDLAKLVRGEKDRTARKKYLALLARDGSDASRSRLLALYRAADGSKRVEILIAMRNSYDAASIYSDFLAANLRARSNGPLRHEAMRQLAASRHPKYFEHLEALAPKESTHSRRAAWVKWCAEFDDLRALNAMAELTLDQGPASEATFLQAVASMRAEEVGDVVRKRWATSAQPILRRAAARLMTSTPRPGDQRALSKMVRDENRDVALDAVRGLAKLGDERPLPLIEPSLSNAQPRVASEALRAMWKVSGPSPEIVERVEDIATSSEVWELRATALDLLSHERFAPQAAETILQAFQDPVRHVRIAAFEAATWVREPSMIRAMIDRMTDEETFSAHVLSDCLADLTSVHLGVDAGTWQRWWQTVESSFQCPPKAEAKKPAAAAGTTASYYGIPIRADNLVFVLDLSGSMSRVVEGKSRLERAKDELIGVLGKLQPHQRFNIIAFGSEPEPWSDKLKRATKTDVQKASKWVRRLKIGRTTNIYDSLELALTMPRVDSVFLLSDGGPTDGRIIDPEEILHVIGQDNSLRRVRINTISIGGTERDRRFMRSLAGENLGVTAER